METIRHLRGLEVAVMSTLALAFAAALPSTAMPASARVRPLPASAGRVLGETLTPPTTASCLASTGFRCYLPFQIQKAYDVAPLFNRGIDGRGRTIVLVDAFGSPTIREDLRTFDRSFGLPDPPSFTILQPAGALPAFPADPFGLADRLGWAGETTLDVEYSHVIAPGASIVLVETPVSESEGVQGFPEIVQAENFVIDHGIGDVISQSFGATEQTFPNADAILDLRGAIVNAARHRVTVLASSGDVGAGGLLPDQSCCFPVPAIIWPAADPLVTAVGGTQLDLDDAGNRLSPDAVWDDAGVDGAGGGLSTVFGRPEFQDGLRRVVGDHRGMPDVSMSSGVDGQVVVFASYPNPLRASCPGPTVPCPRFTFQAGTSEASPLFAGIVALADQAAGRRLGFLDQRLYALGAERVRGIVDVTSGANEISFCTANCGTAQEQDTTLPGFAAAPGFDLASGWGTVDAARFVPELAWTEE